MKTVWKYPLPPLAIPWAEGSEVVHVGIDPADDATIAVWVLLDTDAVTDQKLIVDVFGTGHRIPDRYLYLGTVRQGPFMWHVCGEVVSTA